MKLRYHGLSVLLILLQAIQQYDAVLRLTWSREICSSISGASCKNSPEPDFSDRTATMPLLLNSDPYVKCSNTVSTVSQQVG